MKATILNSVYTIKQIDGSVSELNPDYSGIIDYSNKQIVVTQNDTFVTILHELTHGWIRETGQSVKEIYNTEEVCDLTSYLIKNLLEDNGIDFFERLYAIGSKE